MVMGAPTTKDVTTSHKCDQNIPLPKHLQQDSSNGINTSKFDSVDMASMMEYENGINTLIAKELMTHSENSVWHESLAKLLEMCKSTNEKVKEFETILQQRHNSNHTSKIALSENPNGNRYELEKEIMHLFIRSRTLIENLEDNLKSQIGKPSKAQKLDEIGVCVGIYGVTYALSKARIGSRLSPVFFGIAAAVTATTLYFLVVGEYRASVGAAVEEKVVNRLVGIRKIKAILENLKEEFISNADLVNAIIEELKNGIGK